MNIKYTRNRIKTEQTETNLQKNVQIRPRKNLYKSPQNNSFYFNNTSNSNNTNINSIYNNNINEKKKKANNPFIPSREQTPTSKINNRHHFSSVGQEQGRGKFNYQEIFSQNGGGGAGKKHHNLSMCDEGYSNVNKYLATDMDRLEDTSVFQSLDNKHSNVNCKKKPVLTEGQQVLSASQILGNHGNVRKKTPGPALKNKFGQSHNPSKEKMHLTKQNSNLNTQKENFILHNNDIAVSKSKTGLQRQRMKSFIEKSTVGGAGGGAGTRKKSAAQLDFNENKINNFKNNYRRSNNVSPSFQQYKNNPYHPQNSVYGNLNTLKIQTEKSVGKSAKKIDTENSVYNPQTQNKSKKRITLQNNYLIPNDANAILFPQSSKMANMTSKIAGQKRDMSTKTSTKNSRNTSPFNRLNGNKKYVFNQYLAQNNNANIGKKKYHKTNTSTSTSTNQQKVSLQNQNEFSYANLFSNTNSQNNTSKQTQNINGFQSQQKKQQLQQHNTSINKNNNNNHQKSQIQHNHEIQQEQIEQNIKQSPYYQEIQHNNNLIARQNRAQSHQSHQQQKNPKILQRDRSQQQQYHEQPGQNMVNPHQKSLQKNASQSNNNTHLKNNHNNSINNNALPSKKVQQLQLQKIIQKQLQQQQKQQQSQQKSNNSQSQSRQQSKGSQNRQTSQSRNSQKTYSQVDDQQQLQQQSIFDSQASYSKQNTSSCANSTQKIVNPKDKYDMSDEEWKQFGDRSPTNYEKIKLLGRGGFAMVWLGRNNKTNQIFAMKQILTNNHHQTHIKEIWFGRYFFDKGKNKPKYNNYRGCQNLSRMMDYEIKSQDTWIFYEVCGESLGNTLYDLKAEGYLGEERVYKINYKPLYLTFKKDIKQLKRLVYEIGNALLLLSDQNIVHSDVKTENILIKTKQSENNEIQIQDVKLIDYGSSFTFGNLKHFSMATPEYMAPEILNYILYQNNMKYFSDMLQYLEEYKLPFVIDIWSLGCVLLEMISGLPLWMSLKTIVQHKGKEYIKNGFFAAKGRVFELIIRRQVEVVSNLDEYIDKHNYSGITIDQELRAILKGMLHLDPKERLSPLEVVNILAPGLNLPKHNAGQLKNNNSSLESTINNDLYNSVKKYNSTKENCATQSTTEQMY